MRESKIEKSDANSIRARGGESYKFVSPGRRSVPDRLVLLPIPPKHIEIVNKYVMFIEYKATGKKPKPHQVREHKRLRDIGFNVRVIDSL